ncbi:MAG: hypothetical protein KGI71_05850 [Patescibacteria group bacterium]|nr:hypothetical protein [Patescibacteria group bacterium]
MKRTLARALHRIACRLYPLPPLKVRSQEAFAAFICSDSLRVHGVHQPVSVQPTIVEPPPVESSPLAVAAGDLKAAIGKELAVKRKPKAKPRTMAKSSRKA